METLIQAIGLYVNRHSKDILKDVSLEVKNNDFITIVGPNGARVNLFY